MIASKGLIDVNLQAVEMKAATAAVCERVVAIVDHTKLGRVGRATFVPLRRIALVVTDREPEVADLERAGVEVRPV